MTQRPDKLERLEFKTLRELSNVDDEDIYMGEPVKVVKPDSVPSLNFEKLKKRDMGKFSPILKQEESEEEACDCTEC